jgi:hypothetical protein
VPRPAHAFETWQAVTSPPTLAAVPARGLGGVFWLKERHRLAAEWHAFAGTYRQRHGRPLRRGEKRMLVLNVAVGDTREEAMADELGMGIHAGMDETSVMLHLRPDLVRLDLGRRSVPGHLASYERVGFGKPVSFGWLRDDFGTDGSLGDPTGATAEYGKRKYEAMITAAAQSLAEIRRFDPSPPRSAPDA